MLIYISDVPLFQNIYIYTNFPVSDMLVYRALYSGLLYNLLFLVYSEDIIPTPLTGPFLNDIVSRISHFGTIYLHGERSPYG